MKSLLRIARSLLEIALVITASFALLSFFAISHQYFELMTHFQFQYFVVFVICFIGFILLKASLPWVVSSCFLLLLCGWQIAPYYLPSEKPVPVNTVSLLQTNVLKTNRNFESVLHLVEELQPDVIALQEIDQAWVNAVHPRLKVKYPYSKVVPTDDAFGIGLYSRLPLETVEVAYFGDAFGGRYFPTLVAKALWWNKPITLVIAHPLPPMGGFQVRNSQLQGMAQSRDQWGANVILSGDLNVSPWSPYFQHFIFVSKLSDSQKGFGLQPSWPTHTPVMRTPIDHVLVSESFVVLKRELGPDVGSDHLPVYVELGLKE